MKVNAKPEFLGQVAEGLTVRLKTGVTVVVCGHFERIIWARPIVDGVEADAPRPMAPSEPLLVGP